MTVRLCLSYLNSLDSSIGWFFQPHTVTEAVVNSENKEWPGLYQHDKEKEKLLNIFLGGEYNGPWNFT